MVTELTPSGAWSKLTAFAKRGVTRSRIKRILGHHTELIQAMDFVGYDNIQRLFCDAEYLKQEIKQDFLKKYNEVATWQ